MNYWFSNGGFYDPVGSHNRGRENMRENKKRTKSQIMKRPNREPTYTKLLPRQNDAYPQNHRITESQIQRKTKEIQTEEGIIETKDASDNQEQRANCPI